jgi:hypothetical protein
MRKGRWLPKCATGEIILRIPTQIHEDPKLKFPF